MSVKILNFIEQPILYCNGICANHEDPEQKASLDQQVELLQTVLHRNIVVFNNPTNLGEFFTNSEAQKQKVDTIAAEFARCIESQVQSAGKKRVPLIAHSHGALITKLALEKLTPEVASQVDVYSFGGVVMLPKTAAHNVKNYVNKGDMICRAANDKFDPEEILENTIKIKDRMKLDDASLEDALLAQFEEDWFREYKWGAEKIPKFVNNFWTCNADNVVGVEKKYSESKYSSILEQYDITLIQCAVKPNVPRTFTEVTAAMKEHIAGYAVAVDNTCHRLFTFRATLEELAKTMP